MTHGFRTTTKSNNIIMIATTAARFAKVHFIINAFIFVIRLQLVNHCSILSGFSRQLFQSADVDIH